MTDPKTPHNGGGIHLRWYAVGIGVPIGVAMLTQLEVIQSLRGHLISGLLWDLGRWEILADVAAPAWAISLITISALLRRLVHAWRGPRGTAPTGWFAETFLTETWVLRATWASAIGAVLLIVFAWTREWERFGQQPSAFIYVILLLMTLALLAAPMWWVRHDLFVVTSSYLIESKWFASLDRYFFGRTPSRPRWANALALASVTLVGGLVVLAQLDRLLQGMRTEGTHRIGIAALAGLTEVDLSQKPRLIEERVGLWRDYGETIGDGFTSAYRVVATHVLVDSLLVVPATACIGLILIIAAWRWRPASASTTVLRSYGIIAQTALLLLIVVVTADILGNVFTWYVVDRAWRPAAVLAPANVRILWAATLIRTVGLFLLMASAILLVALRGVRVRRFLVGLGAIRAEFLLLAAISLVLLSQAQAADIIRQWDVTIALLTVFMTTVLAMLLHQTSSTTLHRLESDSVAAAANLPPTPADLNVPGVGILGLRTAIVAGTFALAGTQILLRVGFRLPVGLGMLIPAGMIALLWTFGVALPQKAFIRGDRNVSAKARRLLPRVIGSAVFVVLGIAVLKTSIPQLVFARHEDWYLLFCIVPIAVGIWRLHKGTYAEVGWVEMVIVFAIGVVAILRIVIGDQELSPGALTFVGTMILYGALPFFYSYGHLSLPSRFTSARLAWVPVRPLIVIGTLFGVVLAASLILQPVRMAPEIGTVAILMIGAMFLALIGAGMVRFAERTEAPRLLAAFGLSRTPMFVLLALWLFIGGSVVTSGNNVDLLASKRSDSTGLASGVSVDVIWDRWFDRNRSLLDDATGGQGSVVPMVLVSSSGGGARASVWTAYVLDCLFEREDGGDVSCGPYRIPQRRRSDAIALMSGVSGGGLGLAGYTSFLLDPAARSDPDWVKNRMGTDSLSPTMAWLLYVDLPRALVGYGAAIPNRATVTEWAWEAPWGAEGAITRGVFDLWDHEPDLPPLILNGTSAGDNCRFNASVFATSAQPAGVSCMDLSVYETDGSVEVGGVLAATDDLADYLCASQDLRLSTAAHLGSRFPVIAPPGRVGADLEQCSTEDRVVYVVDGGYLEGSGSGTIVEIWNGLEDRIATYNASAGLGPIVVPFVVHIDNGYEEPAATEADPNPSEVLLPLRTLAGAQFGRYANARQAEALEFDRPLTLGGTPITIQTVDGMVIHDRYVRITTRAHPGVQAPLGWSLSDASIDDLRDQMDLGSNMREIREVRVWLDGPLTYTTDP
ncbi:MAG: hypothetical protein U9R51_10580 [Actinomycetota bacterium]|nr:hypothetical protein [Actinomycetota bacterium]